MASKDEAVVVEFCDAWGDGETALPNIEKILSLVSEDFTWHLVVPTGPIIVGLAAARAEIERQIQIVSHMRCGILKIIASDGLVFTERFDTFRFNGKLINHALTAVYEINEAGLISAWREYFDTADLAQQMDIALPME